MTAATCTVRSAVAGDCGKPAIYTFTGRNGEVFGECADHHAGAHTPVTTGPRVGDKVDVHRYGFVYEGTVVEVGARGAVYAEFTYGNGAKRRVRV